MKLGKMLSVGEVVEHSVPEEPTATVEQPAPATAPVPEHADSTPAPTPVVASVDR